MVCRFSADLTNGSMSLLLNESFKSRVMINGSMNSQSCMSMTGRKNLDIKLVKGLWEIVHLITGQMHMMSKSVIPEEIYFVNNHMLLVYFLFLKSLFLVVGDQCLPSRGMGFESVLSFCN